MENRIKAILIAIIGMFVINSAYADNQEIFKTANKHYKAGNYENAIELYSKILKTGEYSAELYFNIGNANYKTANFPKAILYYEKAKLLSPSDEDINLNLRIANQKIVDKIPVIEPFFLYSFVMQQVNMFDSTAWAMAFLVHLSIVIIALALKMFAVTPWKKRLYFGIACLFGLMALIGISSAITRLNIENAKDTAIVMTPVVDMKSGLDPTAETSFVLHEGTKVKILDTKDNWFKVKISDGREAWIPAKDVEVI